jgi:hypothetical protein
MDALKKWHARYSFLYFSKFMTAFQCEEIAELEARNGVVVSEEDMKSEEELGKWVSYLAEVILSLN